MAAPAERAPSRPARREPSPEVIARIREQYAAGVTVRQIRAEAGVNSEVLYRWLCGGPEGADGVRPLPPIPLRRHFATKASAPGRAGAAGHKALVGRLWCTARAQVDAVEQRLAQAGQQPEERESDARMLAVLVKTLRELAALDEARANARKETRQGGARNRAKADDDRPPQDIDEFRRELARRMDAIAARREAALPDEPEER
jgi:AcrR family transcriptional regulator